MVLISSETIHCFASIVSFDIWCPRPPCSRSHNKGPTTVRPTTVCGWDPRPRGLHLAPRYLAQPDIFFPLGMPGCPSNSALFDTARRRFFFQKRPFKAGLRENPGSRDCINRATQDERSYFGPLSPNCERTLRTLDFVTSPMPPPMMWHVGQSL